MKKVKQQSKKIAQPNIFTFSGKFLILFFIFIFFSLTLFSSGTIESQDGWLYLNVARNLYYHHEPTALPQTDYPTKNVNMNAIKGKDGKWYSTGSLGYSFAMVPAVALSDILHKVYGSQPPHYFPLESDWTVLFFASFTNSFFTAVIGLGVLFYAQTLGQTRKQALLTSLLTIFATYLLPLSKHAFAHPMFIAGLVWTFYFIKRYTDTHHWKYLGYAALSFILVYISYNDAYLLTLPALYVYFLWGQSPRTRTWIVTATCVAVIAAIVVKPFLLVVAKAKLEFLPKVLIDGTFGLLFSPGKSFFLYSPLLLILPFFWWKIRRALLPEMIVTFILIAVFTYFYGKAFIYGATGNVAGIWYGGQAWGARYISPLLPFLMIFVMECIYAMKKIQRYVIVGPLLLASLWIQGIGTSIPYIMQYRDLPPTINIGTTEFSYYDYASFIPRYSPLITMSTELARKVKIFKKTVDHGPFNVRFYDGFETPHQTGSGFIRGFVEEGHISLVQKSKEPITEFNVRVNNISTTQTASASAKLKIIINQQEVLVASAGPNIDTFLKVPLTTQPFQDGQNKVDLLVSFAPDAPQDHVLYITQMIMNGQNINLASLDYPDVSSSGVKTTPIPYQYFGNRMNDPWKMWYLRARINELTFDFWWIKNLYYWDRPQEFLWILFVLNVLVVGQAGYFLYRQVQEFGDRR